MKLDEWSSGLGKDILKIEDGKSVVGVMRGKPVRFYQHWKNNKSTICPGRSNCELCADPDEKVSRASGRFRINFVMKESKDGPLIAKILEGGQKVYNQMLAINSDCPLEHVWVRISRSGTKQNTQYTLQVLAGEAGMIKPAAEKEIAKVALHDLSLDQPEEAEEPSDSAEPAVTVSASDFPEDDIPV